MTAITDTQCSVAELVLASLKKLNVKTIWPCLDSVFTEPVLYLLTLIKRPIGIGSHGLEGVKSIFHVYNNLANSHSSRMNNN